MFSLSIALGTTQWRLLFKTEEAANKAWDAFNATEGDHNVTDDFGQQVVVRKGDVAGLLLENLDKSKLAAVEMSLHQARIQLAAQKAAQTDPSFRAASLSQGPAVLQPMNGFQRN